jgi:hypothetical protein
MYTLLDIPPFDTSSIIEPFTRLVLEKEILHVLDKTNNIQNYTTYVIVDGALDKEIDVNLEIYQPQYRTLYPEAYSKEAGYAQPFLVNLESSAEFREWFLEKGYGNSRGVFVLSTVDIDTLTNNIKDFTVGHMKEGNKETFFRFYDPKIFPTFLRILSENQVEKVFAEQTYWLCENLVATEELDIFSYKNQKMYRCSYKLETDNTSTTEQKEHPTAKSEHSYYEVKSELLFAQEDVVLFSEAKEYIYAKQVCLSLIEQVPHLKEKQAKIKDIYKSVYTLVREGVHTFGFTDKEVNYLWVVANTLHKDIRVLLREDKTYATLFDTSKDVSQSHKGQLLEEIIEKLEEKMKKRSEDE